MAGIIYDPMGDDWVMAERGAGAFMRFADGRAQRLKVAATPALEDMVGHVSITFLPAATTFTMVEFDFKTLEHRLRELAFLNSGVRIILKDLRHPEPVVVELHYEGGLAEFVRYLDSAGVNALFELADELNRRRIELAVVVPEGGVLDRVVELVDLSSAARIERTVEAAIAAYDRSAG